MVTKGIAKRRSDSLYIRLKILPIGRIFFASKQILGSICATEHV